MPKEMEMKCDDCKHEWIVPAFGEDGNEYNGDDLYKCPECGSPSFGEIAK